MRDDFGALWAQTPSSQRRDPTGGELGGGFPCGALDRELWNELMFSLSSVLSELNSILDYAGITPNEGSTNQLLTAIEDVALDQVRAARSMFNVKRWMTQTRVSMSATGAGVLVPAASGFTYNKQSATSIVLVWTNYQTYTPTSNGSILQRFTVGSGYDESGVVNGTGPTQFGTSSMMFITGVGAGAQACKLEHKRDDALAWTTIFNPVASDVSGYRTPNTANFVLAEVEP